MKKRVISALLAATMVTGVAGGNLGSISANADGAEKVLTIPTYWTGENVTAVYFEAAVDRFNEQYEGQYEVVIEEVIEHQHMEKMTQLAQTGNLPVLVTSPSAEFIETVIIPNHLYTDMSDFLEEHPEIKELALDASLEYCTQENGEIVGMPGVALTPVGSYYNTTLYNPDKNIADMTMDEFLDSFGDNKYAFQTGDNAWTSMLFLSALIANEEGGTEWLLENEGSKTSDFNQPFIVDAVAKLQEFWSTNAADNSLGAAYPDCANAFMSNNAAVIFNGSWMNSEFGADNTDSWSNGFDGANVKSDIFPGNIAIGSTKGYGRYLMTNSGTEDEREVAYAFLAFIYSQYELEQYSLTDGAMIPNLDYSDEYMATLEANPLVKSRTELVSGDTTVVPHIANIMYDSIAGEVLPTTLVQLVNGAVTPEEFCQILTEKSIEAADE